jgi:hypothetical protein
MEWQTKLHGALEWAGILLFVAAGLLLLEWPLTRPWLIGVVMALMIITIGRTLYPLTRGKRLEPGAVEGLAFCSGVICVLAHMMWDRPFLQGSGMFLILASSARAWHESRRVSDSSGTITR